MTILVVSLLVMGAFLLRVIPQWGQVFVGNDIIYRGADEWYHVRLMDINNLNFPTFLKYDMFAIYPYGMEVGYRPIMAWIVVGFSKLFGLNYQVVAAFFPAVLGSLALIPVYLLGRVLFSRGVALLGMAIIAVLPGELLHRTLLGSTDHHVLEFLFSTLVLLFLVLSRKDWRWAIPAGISLGLYVDSFIAGSILVVVLLGWGLLSRQFKVLGVMLLLATLVALPIADSFTKLMMLVALLVTSGTYAAFRLPRAFLPLLLVIAMPPVYWFVGKYGLQIYYRAMSSLWGFGSSIAETQPTSLNIAFYSYGMGTFFVLGGLYFAIRNRVHFLFLLWTVVIILLTVGQLKWGYYMALPMSLLSAYLVSELIKRFKPTVRHMTAALLVSFLFMSTLKSTISTVTLPNDITPDWHHALVWLKNNSPPQDPSIVDKEAEYGILTWWDYGNWIIKIAERSPTSNNMRAGEPRFPKFIASSTKQEAEKYIEGQNIKYIIMDADILMGKWYAIRGQSGKNVKPTEVLAMRLWEGQVYPMIYANGTVRIFERR